MKKSVIIFIFFLGLLINLSAQSVGINTTSPHASAALDVSSTTKGMLVPRMLESERMYITSPANGLLVYQTDGTAGFYFWNGAAWTPVSGGTPSELQKITEGSNTGWRILGRNPLNYGDIGLDAIDFSNSPLPSSTRGATGSNSTAIGSYTTASGLTSTALGNNTTASGITATSMGGGTISSGNTSTAMGFGTVASGDYSTSMGANTTASGNYSTAMGAATLAKSYGEVAIGSFNTDYAAIGTISINAADRAFGVGIGTGFGAGRKDGLIVYKDGTLAFNKLTAAPAVTTDRFYILNNKVNYNGAEIGGASELQKITEGSNTGWRILGRNPLNYGDIGSDAMDLSNSVSTSSTNGATGTWSTAFGTNTTASGNQSTAIGLATTASGDNSTAMGITTTASGAKSTAMGFITVASGDASTAMGEGTQAKSYSEVAIGSYNTDYAALGTTSLNVADRAFGVGIGTSGGRKDGLIVYKDGTLAFNKLTAAPAITADRFYILNNKVNYNGAEVGAPSSYKK